MMKDAIMGGEMIRPPMQTNVVMGLFASWKPGIKPEESYLGRFENNRGWTEQILGDPEFQPFDIPQAEHTNGMPALERQIFEAGIVTTDRKVLLSHENIAASGNGPWYLQPARLRHWTGCSEIEAQDLADICKVLDATESMTREFCRWACVKGPGPCIEYLRKFVDLESEDPKLDGLDNLNLTAIEGWEFSLTQAGRVIRLDGTMSNITAWPNPNFTWNWEPAVPKSESGAPAFDWHIARHYEFNGLEIQEVPDFQDQKPDWISSQSDSFQDLVTAILSCRSSGELDVYTQDVQKNPEWTVTQGRVLHSYIRAARSRLERPSALAQGVIKRIQSCSKEKLGSLAKGIFNLVRDGKLKVSRIDQRLIWKAYRTAKA